MTKLYNEPYKYDALQDKLLTREEAAVFLGVKKSTLEVWASTHRYGLPMVKIGRLAKYKMSDLIKFVESRTKFNDYI